MPQDAFTLSHVAKELNAVLCGAKVNKITQPSAETLLLSVYTLQGRNTLEISCSPAFPRALLRDSDQTAPAVCPNFCMLLRKHLSGAVITGVKTMGFERVMAFTFLHKNELQISGEKILYAELMGKYSNLFLVQNGTILGTAKTATLEECAQRPVLVGMPYRLPPAQDKVSATDIPAITTRLCAFQGGDLADFLFRNVLGICRDTALCACHAILGTEEAQKMTDAEAKAFALSLCFFLTEKAPSPCIILKNGKPSDYAVFPPTDGRDFIPCDSVLDAAKTHANAKLFSDKTGEKRRKLLSVVSAQEKKLSRKLAGVLQDLKSAENAEQNRVFGELITSNIYRIKKGDENAVVFDYYTQEERTIALDKNKSPSSNAQAYYKKYNKQKKTVETLSPIAENVQRELEYLSTLKSQIELAETDQDFDAVYEDLVASKLLVLPQDKKGKKIAPERSQERVFTVDGYLIRAGRNNVQNDRITARAKPEFLWLHTKNYHGCHVIIEGNGNYPDRVIEVAAEIAAYYSKGRGGDKIPVDYCLKKYVKKPPQAAAGQVFYTDFRTAYVTPNAHEELCEKE